MPDTSTSPELLFTEDLKARCQSSLGYTFTDPLLLRLALSHKSHANEMKSLRGTKAFVNCHNERLEFLGDAVLELVISDVLYETYPDADEGALSKIRSNLVKAETLSEVAKALQVGDFLLLGRGEATTRGSEKSSILSSTYEALLGAVYLDGGLAPVFDLIKAHFKDRLTGELAAALPRDFKTALQEVAQAKFRSPPTYRVLSETGPDHEKIFCVEALLNGLAGKGEGRNKKEAEQAAAQSLLEQIHGNA